MPRTRTLVAALLVVAALLGQAFLTGCHFHRYHQGYYEYDEFDEHPRYGSHHL